MIAIHIEAELDQISHFKLYPNLKPWVGQDYCDAAVKLLVLGESHYLKSESTYHHDPISWYGGVDLAGVSDNAWMNTRCIIKNGIDKQWKEPSKVIYKNIASALNVAMGANDSPFMSIAFMNYFQRPAEQTGESIRVSSLDLLRSAEAVSAVVKIIRPDVVIFCSTLAWRAAKSTSLFDDIRNGGAMVRASNHPASAWWNRPSKRLKGRSGRTAFIEGVKEVTAKKYP